MSPSSSRARDTVAGREMLEPGGAFDRFQIESLLGQGGMGRVFCAFDTRLHRRVALKVLLVDAEGIAREEAVERIFREARTAAALEHPNKVSVYDIGQVGDVAYIAMEFISGATLRAYVGAPGGWRRKLKWLLDAASALDAAHELGIIHRDVKPENVMVRDDGIVKVLDFGIARREGAPPSMVSPTSPTVMPGQSLVIGTPAYMAPEQFAGRAIDGRADQFAWGVMAYELFTGAPPWVMQKGTMSMISSVLTDIPEPLRARVPDLPRPLDEAVLRTLGKVPSDRFPRMRDVIDALGPLVGIERHATVASERSSALASTPEALPATPAILSPARRRVDSGPRVGESGGRVSDPGSARDSASRLSASRIADPRASSPRIEDTRPSGPRIPEPRSSRERITGTRVFDSSRALDFAVDAEARFARFPRHYTLKGMFFTRVIGLGARFFDAVRPKLIDPPRAGRYVAFADYPQVDYSRIAHAVATGLTPTLPVPEAMRQLARRDLSTFATSSIGRVSLAMLRDAEAAVLKLPDLYAAVLHGGIVTGRSLGKNEIEFTFSDYYGWVDCYPVGTIEGLVDRYGRSCHIEVDVEGALSAVYRIRIE
jgi:uncharacterized protein (TIGR02265 family)